MLLSYGRGRRAGAVPAQAVGRTRGGVRRDAPIRPLADDEQHVVVLHEDQRPLLGRRLIPMGHLLTNGSQLLLKLRVETLPHIPWVVLSHVMVHAPRAALLQQ